MVCLSSQTEPKDMEKPLTLPAAPASDAAVAAIDMGSISDVMKTEEAFEMNTPREGSESVKKKDTMLLETIRYKGFWRTMSHSSVGIAAI